MSLNLEKLSTDVDTLITTLGSVRTDLAALKASTDDSGVQAQVDAIDAKVEAALSPPPAA